MADNIQLRIQDPLSFDGNVAEDWRKFELNFGIYHKAALKKKDPDEVAYTLLNLADQDAIEREKTFVYSPEIKRGDDSVVRAAISRENVAKFAALCKAATIRCLGGGQVKYVKK